MVFQGQIQMAFQDANGNYYSATQSVTGIWMVINAPSASPVFINTMPQGWDSTAIMWERDQNYMGVFRSMSSEASYQFTYDGRAIIKEVRTTMGLQSFLQLNIYTWNEATFNYDIFYASEIDFTTYSDNIQNEMLTIGTLDCGLIRNIHAYGDTVYNVPIWINTGTPTVPVWTFNADAVIEHQGIKLLYNAIFNGPSDPYDFTSSVNSANRLSAFNKGKHGTAPNAGCHYIVNLSQDNITQNNGATTFIGNTILQPQLIQGNQNGGANQTPNPGGLQGEVQFAGTNNSQPYTKNNFSLKNAIPAPGETFKMNVSVSGDFGVFTDAGTGGPANFVVGGTGNPAEQPFIQFVLFEVAPLDVCTFDPSNGNFTPIPILTLMGPNSGELPNLGAFLQIPTSFDVGGNPIYGFSNYPGGQVASFTSGTVPVCTLIPANPTIVTINPNMVYIFAIITDVVEGTGGSFEAPIEFIINNLQLTFASQYDFGISGVGIPAPFLNHSPLAAFRIESLFQHILNYLPTTQTDIYGFPISAGTPYTFKSDFLSEANTTPFYDCIPWQLMISSFYCLQDLQGQSYVSISLNQLFNFCKNVLGCAAAIEYDANGNPTIFRVEPFKYFFDNASAPIIALGFNIFGLTIEPLIANLGCNLKTGYTVADTNSNFGVDSINTELFYNTPLSMIPGTIDFEETDVLSDQYAMEIGRGQQVSQPVGQSYTPANPSTNNQPIAIYVNAAEISRKDVLIYDPGTATTPGAAQAFLAYIPMQRNGSNGTICAQSTDPNATTAPYISGPYYPDTTINMEISPGRNLRRVGSLLHSMLDNLETFKLMFRQTGVMQYNNIALPLPYSTSNLDIGSGTAGIINESQDVLISDLDPQLFKPYVLKFKSNYPVNMYQIIKNNSKPPITFKSMDKFGVTTTWKGFISKVTQIPGTQAPTDFEVWATPDMVIN